LIALAALAVALFLPPYVRAQEPRKMTDAGRPRSTVEAILGLEREIMSHIRAKDAKALGRILTDDFVYRTPEAEIGREDFLKNIASLPGNIISVEGTNQRVSVYGDTAVLTGVQKAVVRTDDGVEHTSTVAFTDIFVKSRGRWKLALAYAVELPTTSVQPQKE
jgi:ketosteroid isomerase-like protein